MSIFKWLERHNRYLAFNAMLGVGTLQGDGSIVVTEEQIVEYKQTKTISQLINLGYAQAVGDEYIINHTEDLEQVITKGIQGRYSSSKWLRSAVSQEKFKNLINDSIGTGVQILALPEDNAFGIPMGQYIRMTQERVQAWRCIEVMAQLVSRNLAYIVDDNGVLVMLLMVDYQKRLNQPFTVIDSDLGGFRTMLGEPGNLRRMIIAVEKAEYVDGKFLISLSDEDGKKLRLELMSLVDAGVATIRSDGKVEIPPAMASWLLDRVKHISDRVSLADVLEGILG